MNDPTSLGDQSHRQILEETRTKLELLSRMVTASREDFRSNRVRKPWECTYATKISSMGIQPSRLLPDGDAPSCSLLWQSIFLRKRARGYVSSLEQVPGLYDVGT